MSFRTPTTAMEYGSTKSTGTKRLSRPILKRLILSSFGPLLGTGEGRVDSKERAVVPLTAGFRIMNGDRCPGGNYQGALRRIW